MNVSDQTVAAVDGWDIVVNIAPNGDACISCAEEVADISEDEAVRMIGGDVDFAIAVATEKFGW